MRVNQTPGPAPVNAKVLAVALAGLVADVDAAVVVAPVVDPDVVPGDGGFGGVGVPLPPVIVAVSRVSAALLAQVIGTFVEPMAIVSDNGLVVLKAGCVTVMDDPWPAVIVPPCVAEMTTAAFVG